MSIFKKTKEQVDLYANYDQQLDILMKLVNEGRKIKEFEELNKFHIYTLDVRRWKEISSNAQIAQVVENIKAHNELLTNMLSFHKTYSTYKLNLPTTELLDLNTLNQLNLFDEYGKACCQNIIQLISSYDYHEFDVVPNKEREKDIKLFSKHINHLDHFIQKPTTEKLANLKQSALELSNRADIEMKKPTANQNAMMISCILAVTAIAAIAVGAVLCFTPALPIGAALLIGGAALFAASGIVFSAFTRKDETTDARISAMTALKDQNTKLVETFNNIKLPNSKSAAEEKFDKLLAQITHLASHPEPVLRDKLRPNH